MHAFISIIARRNQNTTLPSIQVFSKKIPRPICTRRAGGSYFAPRLLCCVCTSYAPRSLLRTSAGRNSPSLPAPDFLQSLIRSCSDAGRLRAIHALVTVQGTLPAFISQLLSRYSALGHLTSARSLLLESTANVPVRIWNSVIRAYGDAGCFDSALRCFWAMLARGVEPDKYTFPIVLRACAGDASQGLSVHREASLRGLDSDVYTRTALIDVYAKSGNLRLARQLFDTMLERDVVSRNALISGYARCGDPRESLRLFGTMTASNNGASPNSITVLNLFPAICELSDASLCGIVHGFLLRRSWLPSVSNGLIDAYFKCSGVGVARRIFDQMPPGNRDAVTWGTMISGYVNNGLFYDALDIFDVLNQEHGRRANQVSVVAALMAATETRDLIRGEEIRTLARRDGIESSLAVATALVRMYAACGDFAESRRMFEGIQDKDVVAWSAAISAASQTGRPAEALALLADMQAEGGRRPNRVTLLSALPACAEVQGARLGRSVHGFALRTGLDGDVSVASALVSTYAKLGCFRCALALFGASSSCAEDVVAWNALVNGYSQRGDARGAMETFRRMRTAGMQPDPGTMVGILPACSLSRGASGHALMVKNGLDYDLHSKNALVDAYAKSGDLAAAEALFFAAAEAEAVLWNTMIAGYAQNGRSREALSLFYRMRRENLGPDVVSFVVALPAVAYLAALRVGLGLHCATIKAGVESRVAVGNCLVDMYAKCGRVDLAREFFDLMESKDVVSWNAVISSFAAHGLGENAVQLFERMPEEPDSVSFLAVLSACRHSGLVEEGRRIFDSMVGRVARGTEHYACMVDLLGRSGRLGEAWDLIRGMPAAPDAAVWGALLGACRTHSNVRLAEIALTNLVRLEPENAAHYVVLSNIYAQLGRWADMRSTRKKMASAGLSKIPGCSWVKSEN